MKKLILPIFIFLSLSLLILPFTAFAALDLEQIYPKVSQGQEFTVTTRTSLVGIIKYYSTWAIIIAILATIIALIAAGFEYLTSAGRPQVMAGARKRIGKAFIGLAILTSSYLILKIVNPQINLLRIRKVPVASGIVALTKRAVEGDECDPSAAPPDPCDGAEGGVEGAEPLEGRGLMSAQPAPLEELVELGQARYLPYNIIDMTGPGGFGRMAVVEYDGNNPKKLNFEDFPIYAIGFWGEDAQNIKVKTYSEKGLGALGGVLNEYTVDGKIKWDWSKERDSFPGGSDPEMKIIKIEDDFIVSSVDFIDPEAEPPEPSEYSKENAPPLPHPPLSITMEGIGPGVYLYSGTSQRYFVSGSSDFGISGFDDQAAEIEIKNTSPRGNGLSEKHDYLAILYDDAQFHGSFRLFFQQRKSRFVSNVYWEEDDFYKDIPPDIPTAPLGTLPPEPTTVNLDNLKNDSDIWNDALGAGPGHFRGTYVLRHPYTAGNVPESNPARPEDSRIDVNAKDQYGKVNGASSIQVFEIAKPSACREVRLCNQKFGKGKCISYTNFGNLAKGLYDSFNLPMPWYAPVNIPAIMRGTVQIRADEQGNRTKELIPNRGGVAAEELMFKRNIRSIVIDGSCLVVLFKNPVENLRNCLTPVGGNPLENTDDCWKKDTPDANSEVFIQSDVDLTDNIIGTCSARDVGRFGIGKVAPCAAAIAVFPIK